MLYSDGTTNAATASDDIVYRTTNPKGLSITGSIFVTASIGSPAVIDVKGNVFAFNITASTYTPDIGGAASTCTVGTWTPAASASNCAQWMRVGQVVTVSGQLSLTPVGAGEAAVYVTLPVASDLSDACQVAGTAVSECDTNVRTYGRIYGDTTNDRAIIDFNNPFGAGNEFKLTYHFTYLIV